MISRLSPQEAYQLLEDTRKRLGPDVAIDDIFLYAFAWIAEEGSEDIIGEMGLKWYAEELFRNFEENVEEDGRYFPGEVQEFCEMVLATDVLLPGDVRQLEKLVEKHTPRVVVETEFE